MGWLTRHAGGARVALKVTPRAAASRVQGVELNGAGPAHLAVRISAPPEAGRANAALIRLLARRWGVPQRDLELVSGAGARHKVLHVHGSPDAVIARLRAIEGGHPDDVGQT
jgi:uncharacterized protein (TIGR00251 family)